MSDQQTEQDIRNAIAMCEKRAEQALADGSHDAYDGYRLQVDTLRWVLGDQQDPWLDGTFAP